MIKTERGKESIQKHVDKMRNAKLRRRDSANLYELESLEIQ